MHTSGVDATGGGLQNRAQRPPVWRVGVPISLDQGMYTHAHTNTQIHTDNVRQLFHARARCISVLHTYIHKHIHTHRQREGRVSFTRQQRTCIAKFRLCKLVKHEN